MKLKNLNKKLIDQKERESLEFQQRNMLLAIFLEMPTEELIRIVEIIFEKHGLDTCLTPFGAYCTLCSFVTNNHEFLDRIERWCECGHNSSVHNMANMYDQECSVCICQNFVEIKADIGQYRKYLAYLPGTQKCCSCSNTNTEPVMVNIIPWRCENCKNT